MKAETTTVFVAVTGPGGFNRQRPLRALSGPDDRNVAASAQYFVCRDEAEGARETLRYQHSVKRVLMIPVQIASQLRIVCVDLEVR